MTSACNAAIVGALAGYSGATDKKRGLVETLLGGLFFMLGVTISLTILGAIAGLVSQAVGSVLGAYWKLFAGFVIIFFGLGVLNLVPFRLAKFGLGSVGLAKGKMNGLVFGLAIGGGVGACSVFCNPSMLMALGMAALQRHFVLGAIIMAVYAVGYSLPLAMVVAGLGLGIGKLESTIQRSASVIKVIAGVLLIGTGLYLLATI